MNEKEFKSIFDQHFEGLKNQLYYRCGDETIAEDISQEVFVKLWVKRDQIEMNKVVGLIFHMGNNLLINQFKKDKVRFDFKKNVPSEILHETPEFVLEEKEFAENLERILENMPEKQRVVFLMSRIDGKKYKEIAYSLNLSVKAVEKRMHGALDYIYQKLHKKL